MCFAFIVVTLFTPGCQPAFVPMFPCADAAIAQEASSVDASPLSNALAEADASQAPALLTVHDGGEVRDAPTRRDASTLHDASTVRGVSSMGEMLLATVLPPTSCHGRRLGANTPGLMMREPNGSLWHLCIKTPSRTTSDHPLANERAIRVSVHTMDAGGAYRELLVNEAPMSANPWTTSVLIALPEGWTPFFHVRAHYANERSFSLARSEPLRLHGEVRIWNVASDGLQTEQSPDRICWNPLDNVEGGTGVLPHGTCPEGEASCPALEGYVCRTLPR